MKASAFLPAAALFLRPAVRAFAPAPARGTRRWARLRAALRRRARPLRPAAAALLTSLALAVPRAKGPLPRPLSPLAVSPARASAPIVTVPKQPLLDPPMLVTAREQFNFVDSSSTRCVPRGYVACQRDMYGRVMCYLFELSDLT